MSRRPGRFDELRQPPRAVLGALPVVVLMGARQTGKTTLARALPGRRAFLSLDDLGVLGQALRADAQGIEAFRASLARPASLRRGVVLYGGEPRVLAKDILALPWSWLVPKARGRSRGSE